MVAGTGHYIWLIGQVIKMLVTAPPRWSLIQEQIIQIGILSLPVVAITGFSTGLVLATQAFFQLANKGLAAMTGVMVAKSMALELGPILTAFMVTGRVGSAMCAEIGSMRVTEQIDALKGMYISPIQRLVVPRFIAGILILPMLTIFSCILGVVGGYLIAVYYFGMASVTFISPIPSYLGDYDVLVSVVKSFVFSILIVTICCDKGMRTTGGASGVGASVTSAVVLSYIWILGVNFFLTLMLSLLHSSIQGWLR